MVLKQRLRLVNLRLVEAPSKLFSPAYSFVVDGAIAA
jgi:hypothetical protein